MAFAVGVVGALLYTVASLYLSPKLAFAGLAGGMMSLYIIHNPRAGFLITAGMIAVERFGRITSDSSTFTISIMRMVGLLTVSGLMLHLLIKKKSIKFDWAQAFYWAYGAYCFASLTYATDPFGTKRALGQVLSNLLFFFVVINIGRDFKIVKLGTIFWLVVQSIICIYTVYDWHKPGTVYLSDDKIGLAETRWSTVWKDSSEWEANLDNVPRAIGSTSHPAVHGINIVIALPFMFYFIAQTRKIWLKALIFLSIGFLLYNVLLTNTRATMLIAMIAVGFCWLFKIFKIKPVFFIFGIIAVAAALPFTDFSKFERILDPSNYTLKESQTLRIRFTYWDAGIRLVQDHFLLGVGIGNQTEIPKYVRGTTMVPDKTSVHLDYLMTLLESGIIGWILFYGFIAIVFYYAWYAARVFRKTDEDEYWMFARAIQIAMLSVLIYGLQCDVFRFPLKGWWFAAGASLLMYEMARARVFGTRFAEINADLPVNGKPNGKPQNKNKEQPA